jgi:DNA integrity scanning protein DisA with diadenylate cyclase activity
LSLWQLFCCTNALTMLVSIARNWSAHATPRDACYFLLAQQKVRADWIFEGILCHATVYDADVVESLLELAIEIAREGREGRRVGTVFTLGDEDAVLARSRPLILDPLLGHPNQRANVT